MKKVCEVCGKEFETKYEFSTKCPECYFKAKEEKGEVNNKAKTTFQKKTVTPVVKVQLDPETVVEEFKKTYDEVTAAFAGDYPEVIADPSALQALVATVFIEKNNRRKGK
ncbi:MAG: hypothetical protein II393_01640 [Cytophagales bacterium]|nr:hypothetical protein [Cytophagales bacterium]